MKIIDIIDKKIIYSKNLGDSYYWEYKFIVEIDEDNYCLINYDDSMSGYIPFSMECVDEGFISAFMKDSYYDNYINFDKSNKLLGDYIDDYDLGYVKDVDVVLIPKEKLQQRIDKAIEYIKEDGTTYLNLANQRKWCSEFSAENILKILGGDEE